MDVPLVAFALVAVAVGAAIQGSVGFGLNLVAAPVLAVADERFVPGPAILGAALLTLLVAVRDRKGLHLGEVKIALLARIPAAALAAVTVAALPEQELKVFFGVLVLLSVAITAFGPTLRPTTATVAVAGALSGYMATATSIGGPPMALVYAGEEGQRIRGTLSGFFLAGTVISIMALAAVGEFGWEEVRLSGLLVVPVVVGYAISGPGARVLDAGRTRPAVLAVATLAAVVAIVDALV